MAIETYPDQLEPTNPEVVIWRFMKMARFADLVKSGELYFCRADLFNDDHEGLPPEEYLCYRFGLSQLLLSDRRILDDHLGTSRNSGKSST